MSPSEGMGRQYLVFVRAGAASLHPEWLRQDPRRNWDCVVSWWGTEPPDMGEEGRATGGVLKCDAFADYYLENADKLRQYRFVMVADDDIRFQPGDISRLFLACDRRGISLAQPALTWTSWVNHPVTLRCPFTFSRAVTFVEMMVPVFSTTAVSELIDTFKLTQSGSGVDWAWAYRLRGRDSLSIIDEVACEHTKRADPVNGALYRKMRSAGIDSWHEYVTTREKFPIVGGIRPLLDHHEYRGLVPTVMGPLLVQLHWLFCRGTHGVGMLKLKVKGWFSKPVPADAGPR